MSTTHAPAPWRVEDHPTAPCQIIAANGICVADVWATDLPGGHENARLLATAPRLLRAITDVRRIVDDADSVPDLLRKAADEFERQGCDWYWPRALRHAAAQLDEAAAEAEGREP